MGDKRNSYQNEFKADTKVENVKAEAVKVEAKAETKVDKAEKIEKADPNFNYNPVASVVSEVKDEAKDEVKAETKVEAKPVTFKKNTTKKGKVVTTTEFSYTVKTTDGKGVHVVGKHNKKIGDTVTL